MSNSHILIVDDEPDLLEMVALRLRAQNYQVETAESGTKALELFAATPPDLVILDIMMPVMDGLQVCEKIRTGGVRPDVPILFLTARGEDWDLLSGYTRGADGYLIKPVDIELLLSETARLLDEAANG